MNNETDFEGKQLFLLGDRTSFELIQAGLKSPKKFTYEYKRPAKILRRHFAERIGVRGLNGENASNVLVEYLAVVEEALRKLLNSHSAYYWLHLSRRVAPVPIDELSPHTAYLSRQILNMAIFKYGQESSTELVDEEFEIADGQSQLRYIGYFEAVAVYSAEYLAYEFWYATSAYRVVNKGGSLVQNGSDFSVSVYQELGHLIDSVDKRAAKGSMFEAVGSVEQEEEYRNAPLLVPVLNVEREPYPLESFFNYPLLDHEGNVGTFKPNYMPAVFQLEEVTAALEPFKQQVIENIGLTPSELSLFLEALGFRVGLLLVESQVYGYNFLQRGWFIYSETLDVICSDITRNFINVSRTSLSYDELSAILVKSIENFTLTPDRRQKIDLWSRIPHYFFIPLEGGFLIDLSVIPHLLLDIAYQAGSQDGAPGQVKGNVFERQVAKKIKSLGVELWLCEKMLVATGGECREVDVSFVIKGKMYVVECKAFLHSHRLDKGDYSPIRSRWHDLVAAHNQAERFIDFLIRNPRGTNYELPPGIAEFVPIVCTPHNEWVASSHEVYWLTEQIPAFCTPLELCEYLSAF